MKTLTKITFMVAVLTGISQLLSAQTVGKAAWMLGGSLSLDIEKYKDVDATTSFTINPNAGYFFADDFAAGLSLLIYDSGFEGEDTYTALGPFVRYYVTNPIFIQAGATFELIDNGGASFGGSVGYSWFLNNGVAIEPALYFQSYNNDGDTGDYTTYGISIGIQAFANHHHGME